MESFFVRFRNALVLIAVLLTQTLLLAVQVRDLSGPSQPDGSKVLLIRSWAAGLVTPFARASNFFGKGLRGGWANYIDLRHTRQQNTDLQKEVARLRLEQAEFAEDALQGRRLQGLLDFRQQYVTTTVAAQVIGTSGVEQSHVLLLDKGADYGLKPDMAVITPDGIVGKLRDVFAHTAQVLEIDDPSSGAGVILASTRIRAIIHGSTDGRVQISNLTADSRIKPGEVVLTSGGDQVFPRGLKVGTIESVGQDRDRQIYTLIQVRPAANLSQLEEVLVITGTQPDLPAQAQKDLAEGEVTSVEMKAEAKRAADLAAEQLPSLNPPPNPDGTVAAPAGAGAASAIGAGNAPGAALKPVSPMHADRYTPGVTPPAAAMTPGAGNADPLVSPVAASPAPVSPGAVAPSSDNAVDPSGSPGPALKRPKKSPAAGLASPGPAPQAPAPQAPAPPAPQAQQF